MNKKLNKLNATLLFLISCLFVIILCLFIQTFYFESSLFINVDNYDNINHIIDNLRVSDDIPLRSLNDSDNTSHSDRSSSFSYSSSLSSADANCFNFIDKYKYASSKMLNKIKNNLDNTTKYTVQKIKLFDKTLSWFFKRSRPGGGRGL